MSDRVCPNCGKSVASGTSYCSCGFSWMEGSEVPAPDIVRSASQRRGGGPDREPVFVMQPPARARSASSAAQETLAMAPAAFDDEPVRATSALQAFPRLGPSREAASNPTAPSSPRSQGLASPPGPASPASQPMSHSPRPEPMPVAISDGVQARTSMLMSCPACSVRISKRAARCPKCETAPWAFCQICAQRILVNSDTCSECGDPQPFETPRA